MNSLYNWKDRSTRKGVWDLSLALRRRSKVGDGAFNLWDLGLFPSGQHWHGVEIEAIQLQRCLLSGWAEPALLLLETCWKKRVRETESEISLFGLNLQTPYVQDSIGFLSSHHTDDFVNLFIKLKKICSLMQEMCMYVQGKHRRKHLSDEH